MRERSVTGMRRSCIAGVGQEDPRARRAVSRATTAARFPPALSPPTPTAAGSTPYSPACSTTCVKAASASSTAAGNGFSGASR